MATYNPDGRYQVDGVFDSGNYHSVDYSASAGENIFGWIGNFVNGVYNDLTGTTSQQREFAQQEYLIDKQNEYNLPTNQMQRMRDAGINPNIAASGIAGLGAQSAQPSQVNSNVGGVAQGLDAVGGVADSVANSVSTYGKLKPEIDNLESITNANNASARESDANADRTNALIPFEKAEFIGKVSSLLTTSGIPEVVAALAGATASDGVDSIIKILKTPDQCRRYDLEMDLLDSQINLENQRFAEIQKHIKEMDGHISLMDMQRQYQEALRNHEQTLNGIDKKRKELYDVYWSDDVMAVGKMILDNYGQDAFDSWLQVGYDMSYWSSKGSYDAEAEAAYEKAFNAYKASRDVDVEFADWLVMHEGVKAQIIEIAKALVVKGGSLESVLTQLIAAIPFAKRAAADRNNQPHDAPRPGPLSH